MITLIEYRRAHIPRFVSVEWIEESWQEKTLLDEERELNRCPVRYSPKAHSLFLKSQVSHHTEELPHGFCEASKLHFSNTESLE